MVFHVSKRVQGTQNHVVFDSSKKISEFFLELLLNLVVFFISLTRTALPWNSYARVWLGCLVTQRWGNFNVECILWLHMTYSTDRNQVWFMKIILYKIDRLSTLSITYGYRYIVRDICMRSRKLVEGSQRPSTGSIWSVHVQATIATTLAHMPYAPCMEVLPPYRLL